MTEPLVSVIIPNYGHSKFLDERILSVLNQTYRNFELIILDDCSPDNGASKTVIERYRTHSKVAHIIYNEVNSGNTFKQWEKGLNLANGEICWIAESDDFCDSKLLEQLVNAYTSRPNIVISYSPVCYTNEEGNVVGYYSREGKNQYIDGERFISRYLTTDNSIQNASCCIFSKAVALTINKKYSIYKGIGDWWFWLEIAECGNVAIVNKHLSYFRRHEGAVTSKRTTDGTNLRDMKELVTYIIDKYHLSKLRIGYIEYKIICNHRNITFDSNEIYEEISRLWNFNRFFHPTEILLYKIVDKFRNHLIRL